MNQKILFICRHNAGRSVIAESLAKQHLPSQFAVASGGSHPTGSINPVVKQFLQGKNLPVPHKYAHSWEERTSFLPDIVITLCDSLQRRIIAMSNILQQAELNQQDLKDELAKLSAM